MLKISIITPSFNQGAFIEETIKSVLNQGYPNLEYIIIDGDSTDNTKEILKKYNKKIIWMSEKDKGQSDAINKGMKMATGDILAFLNSDDLYAHGALHKVAKFFNTHPNAQWITGNYYIIDNKGKKIRMYVKWYKRFLRLFSSYTLLCFTNYIIQPSTFWRMNVQKKVGLFDEELPYEMDYDYWLRIGIKYPLFCSEETFSFFRLHESSKSGFQYKNQFKEEIKVLKKHNIHLLIVFFHKIHNMYIVFIYNLIAKISSFKKNHNEKK